MMQYDRITLGKQARELGFVRDTFEKVCRLVDVLAFFEEDGFLSESLALKGGTAINLTIFNLPRLSVDIDLDYSCDVNREKMLEDRGRITEHIQKYMAANGYSQSPKSKNYHALDSFVYDYINAGRMKDNLKIEINYMLRCHVLPVAHRKISFCGYPKDVRVLCVNPLEILSAKNVALMNRAAPRDLYDLFNAVNLGLLEEDRDLYRKCVAFYAAIASPTVPDGFSLESIDGITAQKVKSALIPVLKRAEHFDFLEAQRRVKEYLGEILVPMEAETKFWNAFKEHEYRPDLLFEDADIVKRIKEHPMAKWKCSNNN